MLKFMRRYFYERVVAHSIIALMGMKINMAVEEMDFEKAREYIDGLNKFGSVLGLESIKALLDVLGNPQDELKVIHVAGTNGKGSTIAFMESILMEAGYKVGKYTSPVVFDYLEKYQVKGKYISEEKFGKLVTRIKEALVRLKEEKDIQPTIFEVETAMAFEYFRDEKCDVVLLETGMGGDMDATNVCSKVLVSAIVSISLDHIGFLGETIEEIAYHKAGIIKKDCPVVVMRQGREVIDVINKYADEMNSEMYIADETSLQVSLKGEWQQYNAGVAVKVMDIIRGQGYVITDEHIKMGLVNAKWPGRFEKISDKPLIIIDGAHNPDAARSLRNTLDKEYRDTKFVYIMGVLADKDFTEVIKSMADIGEYIITVTPPNPRALEAVKLKESIEEYNADVQWAASIEEACDIAMDKQQELEGDSAILAFGSLSYLGRLKEVFKERGIC